MLRIFTELLYIGALYIKLWLTSYPLTYKYTSLRSILLLLKVFTRDPRTSPLRKDINGTQDSKTHERLGCITLWRKERTELMVRKRLQGE